MPINSTHPAYDANVGKWQRCRDAYDGSDAVKERGKEYLPMLGGQDSTEYAAYTKRALFYEATARTIEGFVGAIARKEPVATAPAKMEPVLENVSGDGVGLLEFIKRMSSETMLTGRTGILVEFDEAKNMPHLAIYTAESITNWLAGDTPSIVLMETVFEADPADRFKLKPILQYRELTLDGGKYTVNLWRKREGVIGRDNEWFIAETIVPTNRGRGLSQIPFFWLSPRGGTSAIDKPPLLGMVDVALSHYRSSADLEHGRHFTALPTLWVSGIDSGDPIRIGSATVLKLPQPECRAGYTEFTGQGLGSLERALDSKEHMMAVLGAAVFADQRKGVEAAETARIRQSGETSLLMGVVNSVEEVIEAALTFAADWMGAGGKVEVEINRDFFDTVIDPALMASLLQALQGGAISKETFLYNLQQAEMLQPGVTVDDEAARTKLVAPTAVVTQ